MFCLECDGCCCLHHGEQAVACHKECLARIPMESRSASSKPPRTHTSRSRLKINDGSVGSGPHGARFFPRRTPSPWSSVTTSPSTVCSRLRSCADWRFRKPDLGTWRPVISAFRQRFGRASPCLRAGATSYPSRTSSPPSTAPGFGSSLTPSLPTPVPPCSLPKITLAQGKCYLRRPLRVQLSRGVRSRSIIILGGGPPWIPAEAT